MEQKLYPRRVEMNPTDEIVLGLSENARLPWAAAALDHRWLPHVRRIPNPSRVGCVVIANSVHLF